jgi:hypothetical protein
MEPIGSLGDMNMKVSAYAPAPHSLRRVDLGVSEDGESRDVSVISAGETFSAAIVDV